MEYVAHELGVPVVQLPALQRELSPVADVDGGARAARTIGAAAAGRPPHAHGEGRCDGPYRGHGSPAASWPRATVHTFHGHVLSGYFGTRRERLFIQVERLLARRTGAIVAVSDEVRDDLVRARRRAAGEDRRDPVRLRPLGPGARPTDSERASGGRAIELPTEAFVVGWAGRLTPIKRPHDLIRTLVELTVERRRRVPGRRRGRPRPGERRGSSPSELGVAGAVPVPRLPARHEPLVRHLRRVPAHLRERGNAGRRDRSARERAAPSSRRTRAARRPSSSTASPATSRRSATRRARRPPPRARGRSASSRRSTRPGRARRRAPRFASEAMADAVDALYARLLDQP